MLDVSGFRSLIPCPHASLGYAATGFKTLESNAFISTNGRNPGGPRFVVAAYDYRSDARKHVPPKNGFIGFFDLSDAVLRFGFKSRDF